MSNLSVRCGAALLGIAVCGAAPIPALAAAPGQGELRLAMMDMMPSGGGGAAGSGMGDDDPMRMGGGMGQSLAQQQQPGGEMQQGQPMQGGMSMGDDSRMRMGGAGGMPAQGQGMMPMGQMAQPQQPMTGCPMMMPMMQNGMRTGGGAQPGMMPPMQGGAGSGAGMGMGMGMMDMGGMQPMGSSAARLEGRIAFLRAELGITGAQAPTWDAFANALRAGRGHLDAARAALQESTTAADPMERLEAYENHLRARTEAIHATRVAFSTLFGQLDDVQKRKATTTMLPFIGTF